MEECFRQSLSELMEWKTLLVCVVVMFNPLFWNVVSRLEYRTRILTKSLGSPKRGVILLATCILSLNTVRTTLFHKTIDKHATCNSMQNEVFHALGYLLVSIGAVLVVASSYRLGFYCSFMGDYFGILLKERVTGFPFNVVEDPMYVGSALVYLGLALLHGSLIGIVLACCIGLSYVIAVFFEEPFTSRIYAEHEQNSVKSQ